MNMESAGRHITHLCATGMRVLRLKSLAAGIRPLSYDIRSQVVPNHADPVQRHKPVMTKEVLAMLEPKSRETFIDMTFGAGGHTREILLAAENLKVFGLDRDPTACYLASEMSKTFPNSLVPLLGKFSELPKLLQQEGVKEESIDGILLDAGCSSMQLDDPCRGFSLSKNCPLDLRMDGERYPGEPTGADVINTLDARSLAKIFKTYGEEKQAKKIAQAIIDARFMLQKITTSSQLADLVASTLNHDFRLDKLKRKSHSATKVFQALRIFVNNELNELNYAMEVAFRYLRPGGRLVVLTFHSLEDRIIKRHMLGIDLDEPLSPSLTQKYKNAARLHSQNEMNLIMTKRWLPINNKVIVPTEEEVLKNPRARSAKLRAAKKL
ncbi:probable methyltransferase-like protein 15 homolog [Limulus polyphemus]|uniref:Probable methyltransferase-like protein 15 homolog n=1 Tax=Limulus polyphemus TaxID=6850 RepID=A0ABM1BJX8_LIMPO|nr:probable methyltransferase-like protein 15 homolog [Limulus polyphemus]XP_013783466.1 probable methyltransferase-like protein 15 homolog [Limulus polyphemus]XP_013783467.1 probable methyltransferase-like protein 15 homolog [Limulus polyphemus]XP_022251547.1 probable methyltransferase-like protein 15 homolog [Limulus polyphemus]XP_022251548.1 probable methyltransferase-like protein 15 homolog [Limulus polyphemus]